MKRLLIVALLAMTLTTGCEGFSRAVGEARDLQGDAQAALDEAQAERDRLVESGEATPEQLNQADEVIASAKLAVEKADEALVVLEESKGDLPSLIGGISKLIGASTGHVEIGVFGALIAGLFRARRNRKLAEEIVQSVDPVVRSADSKTKAGVASRQSGAARKLVDQAQGKRQSPGI